MLTDTELKYLRALREKIAERMKYQTKGDRFWNVDTETVDVAFFPHGMCKVDLYIPHAIDLENPERGLLGMLTGISSLQAPDEETDNWAVIPSDKFGPIYEADTPYLALLKALAAQWNVEVKE